MDKDDLLAKHSTEEFRKRLFPVFELHGNIHAYHYSSTVFVPENQ